MSNNQNLAHIQGLVLKCKYTHFFTYRVIREKKYLFIPL